MRAKPLKTRGLILSLSKDEAKGSIGLQQERRRSQPPRARLEQTCVNLAAIELRPTSNVSLNPRRLTQISS
ncbi:MAG: hypothetical protein WCF79_07260, partial [Rhodomicrobium sp.]